VITALVELESELKVRWRRVPSIEKFLWVSIGMELKVWAVNLDGHMYFRNGVDPRTDYLGRDWTQVVNSEVYDVDMRFRMVSVGDEVVWALSRSGELYFRENVSKMLPLGTSWTKVDKRFKFVSVNGKNEVKSRRRISQLMKYSNDFLAWGILGVCNHR